MCTTKYLFVDSGTGGLPYMLELLKQEPSARCVYVGDTAHFPYGEKSLTQIKHFATDMVEKAIVRFMPDIVVIACNTISVAALDTLRRRFAVPFVGTVPAIKLASKVSKNRCIGLLATRHTVEDPYTLDLIAQFAKDCTVVKRGDAELISFIEHRLFSATYEERCAACAPAVDFFKENGADTIVLACTHFLHLVKEFTDVAGESVTVVDSRQGVARRAVSVAQSVRGMHPESAMQREYAPMHRETAPSMHPSAAGMHAENTMHREYAPMPPLSAPPLSDWENVHGVYVTALKNKSDEEEYKTWCTLYGVPFKGIL